MNDKRNYLKTYRQGHKARVKRVTVTFSNDEYARFVRVAQRDDMPVGTLVTACALAALDRTDILPKTIAQELSDLKFLITNIANNVNQMARHSNTVRAFVEEGALLAELERLQQVVESHTSKSLRGGHDH